MYFFFFSVISCIVTVKNVINRIGMDNAIALICSTIAHKRIIIMAIAIK